MPDMAIDRVATRAALFVVLAATPHARNCHS